MQHSLAVDCDRAGRLVTSNLALDCCQFCQLAYIYTVSQKTSQLGQRWRDEVQLEGDVPSYGSKFQFYFLEMECLQFMASFKVDRPACKCKGCYLKGIVACKIPWSVTDQVWIGKIH